MSDLKQARMLLEAAQKDVSALRGMDDAAVFADEIFGFHAQQAAEKLLKAWLASLGEAYPLSHDLASLLDVLRTCGADVARFDELVDYTRYAVRLRYTPRRTRREAARPRQGPRAGGGVARRRRAAADGGGRRLTMADVNVRVPALEMRVKCAASGIGPRRAGGDCPAAHAVISTAAQEPRGV